jgi:hypothetical protein
LEKQDTELEIIKKASEELTNSSMKLGEAIYKQQGAGGFDPNNMGATGADANSGAKEGEVVDEEKK